MSGHGGYAQYNGRGVRLFEITANVKQNSLTYKSWIRRDTGDIEYEYFPETVYPILTLISAIQGSSDTSPMTGSVVTVSAIVVGDFQSSDSDDSRNMKGFYLQEEDSDSDNDDLTSEGIFIYEGDNMLTDVNIGDLVEVTGTVAEYNDSTQLSTVTSVKVVSSSNTLPTATVIVFPKSVVELEAYAGMRTDSPPDVLEGVNGAVKIASLNVLNFFTTLNKGWCNYWTSSRA
jgi:predicted extracellular nuclease